MMEGAVMGSQLPFLLNALKVHLAKEGWNSGELENKEMSQKHQATSPSEASQKG